MFLFFIRVSRSWNVYCLLAYQSQDRVCVSERWELAEFPFLRRAAYKWQDVRKPTRLSILYLAIPCISCPVFLDQPEWIYFVVGPHVCKEPKLSCVTWHGSRLTGTSVSTVSKGLHVLFLMEFGYHFRGAAWIARSLFKELLCREPLSDQQR